MLTFLSLHVHVVWVSALEEKRFEHTKHSASPRKERCTFCTVHQGRTEQEDPFRGAPDGREPEKVDACLPPFHKCQ